MAPPPLRQFASTSAMASRPVTEDTPPDLLEGTMDLTVILPTGHRVNMAVHRSTPMMDLLIQVTTAHKVSPGGHVIHVVSDNRLVSYKPSTPIGTLETSVIQIVAKNKMNEEAKQRRAHLVTQAIEKNVRLKVNLPRNQLAVYRVPPKTLINDVLAMVCKDRCLEKDTHEIRHPVNVDEKLRGSCTLADYQLQEVSVVPKDYRAPPLSVTDLITMAAISHPEDKKRRGILSLFSRKTKSSTGESSLSSGSAGERSVSPARSDESVEGHPTPVHVSPASSSGTLTNQPLSRPASVINLAKSRKRQAPAPPPHPHSHTTASGQPGLSRITQSSSPPSKHTNGKSTTEITSTRDVNRGHDSDEQSPYASPAGSEISSGDGGRALHHSTNLTSVTSTSNLSLASRNKRRAPAPPKQPPPPRHDDLPSAIPEEVESPVPSSASSSVAEEEDGSEKGQKTVARSPSPARSSSPARSPSPASSHVSSVSSLSSVEQHSASTPQKSSPPPPSLPEEEEVRSPPTPPPPSETTFNHHNEASLLAARRQMPVSQASPSNATFNLDQIEPPGTHIRTLNTHHTPIHTSPPQAHPWGSRDESQETTVTGKVTPSAHDLASGIIFSNRIAAGAPAVPPPLRQHHQASRGFPASSTQSQATNYDLSTSGDSSPISERKIEKRDNNSAKQGAMDITDAILPYHANTEGNVSDIPTFRIVTKSQIVVKNDTNEAIHKSVDGGISQKFGSKDKRSGLDSDSDDLDIDEDMFEPYSASMSSLQTVHNNFSSASPMSVSTPPLVPRRTTFPENAEILTSVVPIPRPRNRTGKTVELAPTPELEDDICVPNKHPAILLVDDNADILSLLSEEGVDELDETLMRDNAIDSLASQVTTSPTPAELVTKPNSAAVQPNPIVALPAQTASSSYRAGYLAMISQLPESDEQQKHQEVTKLESSLERRPSSLCSDTDHEVQTRMESFNSETSEDSEGGAKEEAQSEKTHSAPASNAGESSSSSSSSRSCISSECSNDSDDVATEKADGKEQPQANERHISSSSSSSPEEESGGESERDIRLTAIPPLSTVRLPDPPSPSSSSSSRLTTEEDSSRRQIAVSARQRTPSSSSASSVRSSATSSVPTDVDDTNVQQQQLSAHHSQEISKKNIETHLEAAFAEVTHTEEPPLASPSQTSNWEYRIPDPPTPFKDNPRVEEETSSSSRYSDTVAAEVISDVPSGFRDSPVESLASSITEAKNTEILEKVESDLELPEIGESSDSIKTARRGSLSSEEGKINNNDLAKRIVIEELKTVVGDTESIPIRSQPRIVELKPKTPIKSKGDVSEDVLDSAPMSTLTSSSSNSKVESVLPARLNFPVEHSFVPRVQVNRVNGKDEKEEEEQRDRSMLKGSISSYESCSGNSIPTTRSRSSSSSETSYESAPPPVPDAPPPSDSERSSTSGTGDSSSSRGRTRVMNFSISTYRSRAEETSYDKRLVKAESFTNQTRPSVVQREPVKIANPARDRPKILSYVDELLEEKENQPEKSSFAPAASIVTKILSHKEKALKSSATGKPTVPPKKPFVQPSEREGFGPSVGQPVVRMNSLSDRRRTFEPDNKFAVPEPARPPRRLQRNGSQERLGRATSLGNLAAPNFELRKAQSSSELYGGSGGSGTNTGGSTSDMPGIMPGMPMMGGMMMHDGGGGGANQNDARLADEFMKLQQDFFKWQQQLLQNQHVLHSRVAPLASNPPPQLQSLGVMRDIMSQSLAQDGTAEPNSPVERVIPIKMEIPTTTTTSHGSSELHSGGAVNDRMSRSMQDITGDMSHLSTGGTTFARPTGGSTQPQTQKRWAEEPSVSVGSWNERPSQPPVGVYHDRDYVTSDPRSRSIHDLSSSSLVSQQQQRLGYSQPTEPQQFAQPQSQQFAQPQPPQFAQPQMQNQQPRQFQSLPPQQQSQFVQFLQQQQPAAAPQHHQPQQEPDRATFWRDFDARRQEDPARPPRRNSRQESPPQISEPESKPVRYFGQEVREQDPPQTYYFNGDGSSASDVAPTHQQLHKFNEREVSGGGPRYTSVVTLSSDAGRSTGRGDLLPPAKDKVRSVVQLNNSENQPIPPRSFPKTNVAPVVRGFRHPPQQENEEEENSTPVFQNRILNNTAATSKAPQNSIVPARISPPKIAAAQPRVLPPKSATHPSSSSSRTSPTSGLAFAGVQLRPVPSAVKASPPTETPSPASVTPLQETSMPQAPPPPPAPPSVPPPPPMAPPGTGGERRTASGKRIVSPKKGGPLLDPREELMMAIRKHGGHGDLRRTNNFAFAQPSS